MQGQCWRGSWDSPGSGPHQKIRGGTRESSRALQLYTLSNSEWEGRGWPWGATFLLWGWKPGTGEFRMDLHLHAPSLPLGQLLLPLDQCPFPLAPLPQFCPWVKGHW
jgi:hypothetical protein